MLYLGSACLATWLSLCQTVIFVLYFYIWYIFGIYLLYLFSACLATWLTLCQTASQDLSSSQKTRTVTSKKHFCPPINQLDFSSFSFYQISSSLSICFRLNRDSGSSGAFQLLGDVHTRWSQIFVYKYLKTKYVHTRYYLKIRIQIFPLKYQGIFQRFYPNLLQMLSSFSNRFSDHCTNTVTETSKVEKEHVQVSSSIFRCTPNSLRKFWSTGC